MKQCVLVTGGTRGIGFAIAQELECQGHQIIVSGSKDNPSIPKQWEYIQADFSKEDQFLKFCCNPILNHIDILINNAGINRISPFQKIKWQDFDDVISVNLKAAMGISQAVLGGMIKKKWGRIINICSIWGSISKTHRASYSASKFGLDGMTVALAQEVSSLGILANCVSPGFIDTELTQSSLSKEEIEELVKIVPIGRLGKVEEVAKLVGWLTSKDNTFISGQNIVIDGGFSRG